MRKILKTVFTIEDPTHHVPMPLDAKIVHVESQNDGFITLWFVTANESEQVDVKVFQLISDGEDIPDDAQYIGTACQRTNKLVYHIFERLLD